MQICDTQKCTGCFACKNSCPKNAISVKVDDDGRIIPYINDLICIDCGLCKKVCPVNGGIDFNEPLSVYAARSKMKEENSSSGGVASVLYRKFINDGNAVVGSLFENGKFIQKLSKTYKELDSFKGSKYVQSYTADSYIDTKRELEKGKKVLYVGTPCQIAGVKKFIGDKNDGLFTVDLICHGTPPFKYLNDYIESSLKKKTFDNVKFRGKLDFYLTVSCGEKILYKKKNDLDLYFSSFLHGLTYMESCYDCPYSQLKRCSDLTIGDFWGLDRSKLNIEMKGKISVVLANTEKGKWLLELCSDELLYDERELFEAVNEKQGNLIHPSKKHNDRNIFINNYKKLGFKKAVKKTGVGKNISLKKCKRIFTYPVQLAKKMAKKILRKGK